MTDPKRTPLPRSVLVATDDMYREIAQDPASVASLEDLHAMVIPLTVTPIVHEREVEAVRNVLSAADQLIPAKIFIRNPYTPGSYELADVAIESFASAKYHVLANVARLLGAQELRFIEAKAESRRSSIEANALTKIGIVNGDAKVGNEIAKRLEERLEGEMTFPGSEADIDAATNYLQQRLLTNDHQLRGLVEMRTGTNPINGYKMTMNGFRESTSNFHSALELANVGPARAASIGAGFVKAAESVNSIEITTDIKF